VGGRIGAIGLSVVMPEGPRRIPGRFSVAPTPPAVRKLSGTYISSASAFGFWLARVSRPGAMFVARGLRPRDSVVILANVGLRSRRQFGKGREFDNVRHYLHGDNSDDIHQKATNCGPLALVSRRYTEILGTRPSVRLRRWRVVPSQGSPCSRSLHEGRSDAHSRADDLAQ